LRTSWQSVRPILLVGISLASVGVVATALAIAAFAILVLNLSMVEGFLLGAIVSSTDAAAVFSILRSHNLALKGKLKQVLEFEAGSNDPMAIFLTIAVLSIATHEATSAAGLGLMFLLQAGIGLASGWAGGKGIRWLINHIGIEYEGLYSVLSLGLVIFLFGVTSAAGGSGFLAVYIAGIVLGNTDYLHKRSMLLFHDGIAWIAQISLFLALGLLVFPSDLLNVWKEGLLLAFFMMFVARPVSVFLAAPTAIFSRHERILVSWVGLRGAAPIILATLPWIAGLERAEYIFELVFFVVLTTVVAQGASIPWLSRRLKLTEPLVSEVATDVASGRLPAGFMAFKAKVLLEAPANGHQLVTLSLPSGVVLTSVERGGRFIIPKGDTVFETDDEVLGLARPSSLPMLRNVFGEADFT